MSTGFVPTSPAAHQIYNIALGSLLLLASLPLLLVLTLLVFATQGWRMFYIGPRIGKDGRTYGMFKFRTLDGHRASEMTRDRVLPADSGIETPLGAFLRDSRLDELPQLANVVMGHMNVCGPRPVRPQLAALRRLEIPDYDVRFSVKPGLIGHTQAYMHHGTSKAVRARYNHLLCQAPVRYRGELGMIGLVAACVMARTLSKLWEIVAERFFGHDAAHRERARAKALKPVFVDPDGIRHRVCSVGRKRLTFDQPARVGFASVGDLVITLPSDEKRQAKVKLARTEDGRHDFAATSDCAHHIVSRYLWQAVVVPHRSHFWANAFWRWLTDACAPRWSRARSSRRAAGWAHVCSDQVDAVMLSCEALADIRDPAPASVVPVAGLVAGPMPPADGRAHPLGP